MTQEIAQSKKRTEVRLAAILIALAMLGAGCGGDTQEESSDDSTPDTTATEDGGDETSEAGEGDTAEEESSFTGSVTLMVIAPETDPANGGIGAYPEISAGARAAAAEVNAGGGINGLEVQVEVCDTKQDANEAFNCAQQAVEDEVLAVVGMQDTRGTSYEALTEGGVPNVIPFAAPGNLSDANSYPGFGGTLAYLIGGLTNLAAQPDVESISVVFLDGGSLRAQLEQLSQAVTAVNPGLTIDFVAISPNQGDYSATVTTASESDAVYLAMPPDAIVQFRTTAAQLGVERPTGVPAATVQGGAIEQLGDLANGLYAVAGYLASTTESTPEIDNFKAAMEEHEPDAYITDLTVNGYLGVITVAEVLEGADATDQATLKAALDEIDGIDTGLSPSLQFVEAHPVFGEDFPRLFNGSVVHVQVVDGEMEPLTGYVDVLTGE